ncbi:MAG: hypothetical protein N7Q72_02430, partial [Spiroplasma sp. Tabriz.8]|nr:hypothetical protein [Spiroplasma sp. Tabriz.8]
MESLRLFKLFQISAHTERERERERERLLINNGRWFVLFKGIIISHLCSRICCCWCPNCSSCSCSY